MRTVKAISMATAVAVGLLLTLPAQSFGLDRAPAVEPWLTTPQQDKLLEPQPAVDFRPGAGSGATIDVDDSKTYQTMDGFGASFTDSSAWLVSAKLDSAQRDALMKKLFASDTGIGLSFLRQPLGASDFTADKANYTYDDTCCDLSDFSIDHDRAFTIPIVQQARQINPDIRLMGTPWSPPAWMKTSGSLNGGGLKPDSHGLFADYLVKTVQAYAEAGLKFDLLSMQNEPHHEAAYPSMRMEPADQAAVVKNELGPKLAQAGIDTKVVAWDHNWKEPGYPTAVLDDQDAKQYLAGSAFHCYEGEVGQQSETHNAHPDKGIWFTECSGGDWSPDFGGNLKWNVQNLIIGSTRHWAKSVSLWNMALDQNNGPTNGGCTNCRGVVTINDQTGKVDYNVEYYVLGHASKFVKPGAKRIESTASNDGIETVAFSNPDGSNALIALNTAAESKKFNVHWKDQSADYELPAGAVTTMTWHP